MNVLFVQVTTDVMVMVKIGVWFVGDCERNFRLCGLKLGL